jgi:predicted neuraminidase
MAMELLYLLRLVQLQGNFRLKSKLVRSENLLGKSWSILSKSKIIGLVEISANHKLHGKYLLIYDIQIK